MTRWQHGVLGGALVAAASGAVPACGWPDRVAAAHLECSAGECHCEGGFRDCDGDLANGCETNVTANREHCGGCGNDCRDGSCEAGICACNEGFADCDGLPANGCEVQLATDGRHCGLCGHDCEGGGCYQARCLPTELVTGLAPQALALGAEELYVAAWSDVLAIPLASGGPSPTAGPRLVATNQKEAQCIALTESHVFWRTKDAVWRAPRAGGEPEQWAKASALPASIDLNGSRCLAISSNHVHWYDAGGSLESKPIDGGSVTQALVGSQPSAIVADAARIYWIDAGGIRGLEAGAAGQPETIVARVWLADLVLAGDEVYFAQWGLDVEQNASPGLWAVGKDGTGSGALAEREGAISVTVHGQSVFWGDYVRHEIVHTTLPDLTSVVLATSSGAPRSIVASGTHVYWTNWDAIMRLVR